MYHGTIMPISSIRIIRRRNLYIIHQDFHRIVRTIQVDIELLTKLAFVWNMHRKENR